MLLQFRQKYYAICILLWLGQGYTHKLLQVFTTSYNETNADFVHSKKKSVGKILILFSFFFFSLDFKRVSNYNTIGATIGATGSPSAKLIFCVHGNRYGVTRCCNNFNADATRAPDTSSVIMTGVLDDVEEQSQNTGQSGRTNDGTSPSGTHRIFLSLRSYVKLILRM